MNTFLGASQFLFATDYPHDDPGGRMKYKDVQLLRDHTKISEEDKDIIRYKSAAAMLPAEPDQLLEVRNFGETTLNEVREKLTSLGLRLGMRLPVAGSV